MRPSLSLLSILLILTACEHDRSADQVPAAAAPPSVSAPLAVAPTPLPAWLPPARPLPGLPPAIPEDQVSIDFDGHPLRPADVIRRTSLDGTWRCSGLTTSPRRFADDAQLDRGFQTADFADGAWDGIAVPLDWYQRYPKARDPKAPFTLGWYRRTLELPAPEAGERSILRFGVIGYEADLWVNGQAAGGHHGDFTPWEVDVTGLVRPGRNVLALRVRSDLGSNWGAGPARHAYGSQWGLDNIKGGLWQPCELRREPALRITRLLVSPRPATGSVRLDWQISNHGASVAVRLRAVVHGARQGSEAERPGDAVVAEVDVPAGDSEGGAEVPVPGIRLWTPDAPHLYRATLVALAGGRVAGVRSERFGQRSFAAVDGGFRLNGRPVWLFGENLAAVKYGGLDETPAVLQARIAKDLAGLKANGYTMVRNAHMPILPEFLACADELGLMVYDEWAWCFTTDIDPVEFPRRNAAEVAEWVARDHNHPSVVMWSCSNEVVNDAEAVGREMERAVRQVRSLDRQGRPVCSCSGGAEVRGSRRMDTDVLDLHLYHGLGQGPWSRWESVMGQRVYPFMAATFGDWRSRRPFIIWEAVGFSWGQRADPGFAPGDPERYLSLVGRPTSFSRPDIVGFAGTIGMAAAATGAPGNRLGRAVYGRRIGEMIRRDPDVDGWAPWFQDPALEEARQWTQPVLPALYGANRIAMRHPLGGAVVEQTLVVINQSSESLEGAVARLVLVGGDGAERLLSEVALPSIPALGRHETLVALALPPAPGVGWWQLRVSVTAGGAEVARLGYDLCTAPAAQPRLPAHRRTALLPGGDQVGVRRWLEDVGVTVRIASGVGDLGDAVVAILAPGARVGAEDGFALRGWVRQGGDLLVLEQPAGEVAAIRQSAVAAANTFVDLVVPAHPLFAGLSPEAFDISDHPEQSLWVKAGLLPITANVLAARGPFAGDTGVSAVVAEGSLGAGRMLASQLLAIGQWGRDAVATAYLRNLAGHLLAAGAARPAGLRAWQEVGGGIPVASERCRRLDLRAVANRGFADEVDGDGAGGWTDQGGNDMRQIPTGPQTLAGVTFEILDPAGNGGRSCIVLGGAGRPAFPREAAGIPVGAAMSRLFFLHTAAWVGRLGEPAMSYRIRYADGGVAEVPVRAGLEVDDWWRPGDLPGARLGLSVTNDQLRDVGLFLMPWENPRPEAVIAMIDVVSPGTMVPIVVAITGETANPHPARFDAAGDPARWRALRERPGAQPAGDGPGRPAVEAAAETAPGGARALRISFPVPAQIDAADRKPSIPVAMIGLPPEQRGLLADGERRYLTCWIKTETAGTLDLFLPRQDWKERLESGVHLDPSRGWQRLRLSLEADLQLGQAKRWEAKDLRGELLLYHGRSTTPTTPASILIADPRLE